MSQATVAELAQLVLEVHKTREGSWNQGTRRYDRQVTDIAATVCQVNNRSELIDLVSFLCHTGEGIDILATLVTKK